MNRAVSEGYRSFKELYKMDCPKNCDLFLRFSVIHV